LQDHPRQGRGRAHEREIIERRDRQAVTAGIAGRARLPGRRARAGRAARIPAVGGALRCAHLATIAQDWAAGLAGGSGHSASTIIFTYSDITTSE